MLGVKAVVATGSSGETGSGLSLGGKRVNPLSWKGDTLFLPSLGKAVGKLGKLLVLTISSLGLSDLGLTRLGLLGTWWWNGASFSSASSIKLKGSAVEVGRV